MNELYLEHHGILGQKWGVRRYQNPDGTLTSAGKARYNADGTRKRASQMSDEDLRISNNRLQAERNYNQLTGRTQPSNILNSDMAFKVGASVLASVGTTLLVNQLSGNAISTGSDLTKKVMLVAGKATLATMANNMGGNISQVQSKKK